MTPATRRTHMPGLSRATHLITRTLHRIHPAIPVVKRWPGNSRIRAAVYRRLIQPGYDAVTWRLAVLQRSRLEGTTFIGVTGSAGKTMTKLLVSKVLSTRLRGGSTSGTRNNARSAVRSLLYVARKSHQFHVVEMGIREPGRLQPQLTLVRPSIAIVTNIGTDHISEFGTIEAIAEEKALLVRSLPRDGVAVLNADDPRVLAMRNGFAGRVITFGTSREAMVTGLDIKSSWPAPLSFDVAYQGQRAHVQTQLFGELWVSSILAAIATGVAFDVPLADAARAVQDVRPNSGRMSPVLLPDGVACMRDDWKASVHTVGPALEFLRTAQAARKVAILGTISDSIGTSGKVYVDAARHALEVADTVCFVGPRAFAALRAAPADRPERLRAFATAKAAHEFLRTFLQPGDLMLLKGSNTADHLYRLAFARMAPVACWQMDCRRQGYCDTCELVGVASDSTDAAAAGSGSNAELSDGAAVSAIRIEAGQTRPTILIGLGNPGDKYKSTPHNVGHMVVDDLATALKAEWSVESDAQVAHADWDGQEIWLVKPNAWMNHSGPILHRIATQSGFGPQHCILVYDDLDLPLGAVRARIRGSDGGHRGVRSILEAFQTDQFRRVKLGVKRPGDGSVAREAVLRPFDADEMPAIRSAVDQARKRLNDLVFERLTQPPRSG